MLVEENPPSSSSMSLVVHLIIVGFHHKKGHQVDFYLFKFFIFLKENGFKIEYSYPLLSDPIDERWSNIGSLALPDGVHNREHDLIYFHLPSMENQTLFGLASYRQIDANVCFI